MNETCDTMWMVMKNTQTITMKMCIKTILPIIIFNNTINNTINNTNFTFLQNLTLTNITSADRNNSYINNTESNETKYNYRENNTKINYTTPSSSTLDTIYIPLTPSSMKQSNIRGRTISPAPSLIYNISNNNLTSNKIPNIRDNTNYIVIQISIISSCVVFMFIVILVLYKRRNRNNRIHSCTPSITNNDLKSRIPCAGPSQQKYKTKKNKNRPKDYMIEYLNSESTIRTEPRVRLASI